MKATTGVPGDSFPVRSSSTVPAHSMPRIVGPATSRFGSTSRRGSGRTEEEPAEGAEEQAVARPEARPMDLAFEDAELVAEGENLDLKCGFGLPAEDKEIEQ